MKETKFKNTEIGLIPEDWEVKVLGEIAVDMADGPFGSNLKTEHYTKEKQVRIIQLSNIGDSGWIDDNVKYTTFEHANTLKRCKANKGCVLIAKMMPAGRSIICPDEEKEYILGSDVVKVNFNDKIIKSLYFVYHTKSCFFLEQIAENTQGSTRQRTSITKLRNMLIPLPPTIEEQSRIAQALSDIDSLIDSLDKLIQKKRNIKQGAMQELLTGKKRLKGFVKPWKREKLGEILDYEQPTKYIVSNTNYMDNGIPVLTAGKTFILGYTTETKGVYSNLPTIIFDDFTTESKFVDFKFKVKSSAMKMLHLKEENKYDLRFVFELMQILDFSVGDHKRHWISQCSEILINIPQDKSEQTAIATILSDMDSEIESLEAKKEKYKSIKQGMMQELLSGRIRLV